MRRTLRKRIERWAKQDAAKQFDMGRGRIWRDLHRSEFPTPETLVIDMTVAPITGDRRDRWSWDVQGHIGHRSMLMFSEGGGLHRRFYLHYMGASPDAMSADMDAREVADIIRSAHAAVALTPEPVRQVLR